MRHTIGRSARSVNTSIAGQHGQTPTPQTFEGAPLCSRCRMPRHHHEPDPCPTCRNAVFALPGVNTLVAVDTSASAVNS